MSVLLLSLILGTNYIILNWSYDDNEIYGQEEIQNNSSVKTHIVTIPKGSANPSIDITDLEVRKWYIPPKLEIESGDIVKWINNDTESHTVTSGVGSGIQSLLTNKLGTANVFLRFDVFFHLSFCFVKIFHKAATYYYFD